MCEAIGSLLSGLEQPKTQEAAERTGQVGLIHVGDDLRDPERERRKFNLWFQLRPLINVKLL